MAETRKPRIEVASEQLKSELEEIKQRISVIETITAAAHRPQVEALVRKEIDALGSKTIEVLAACKVPRTRQELMTQFSFNSAPALDYHLGALRAADLLLGISEDGQPQRFVWSNLFKRLPPKVIKELLNND
ncbi:MAG TPA: hypothetical protein VHN77_15670 [Phycisphaerales bacterium]|nr:hypothetical protein [Phycisphaerales bacterium]